MSWSQINDPLNNPVLSTLCAALPIVVLLGGLASFRSLHFHSLALASLMGLLVMAQAYVFPFTLLVH